MLFLEALLQAFPKKEHLREKCRPMAGSDTCRYLTCGAEGFRCAKFTGLREAIDKQKDAMRAKGDNCEGILAVIVDHAQELVGKRVLCEEIMPTRITKGSLMDIEIEENGNLSISWEEKEKGRDYLYSFSVRSLRIAISNLKIKFSFSGGEVTIFLD
jgi:hypothetical protein